MPDKQKTHEVDKVYFINSTSVGQAMWGNDCNQGQQDELSVSKTALAGILWAKWMMYYSVKWKN